MKKFNVEIITPEKAFFSGEIEGLVLESTKGKIGILAGRAPVIIGLAPGKIKVTQNGTDWEALSSEGFAVVEKDKTIVMCQDVNYPEDVAVANEKREQEDAKRREREAQGYVEYKTNKASMIRAFERIKGKKNTGMAE